MTCLKKDTCVNSRTKCAECNAMSDIHNHYPCYEQALTLREFIEKFVCRNTLIRLWTPSTEHNGLTPIEGPGGVQLGMEWQVLDTRGWQHVFGDWLVVGVRDILCETNNEAVNIIITKSKEE